jgi:hypothetical protein
MEAIGLWNPRIALLIPVGIIIAGYVSRAVERSIFQSRGMMYRPEHLPTDARIGGIIVRIIGVICLAVGLIGIVLQILRLRGVIPQ